MTARRPLLMLFRWGIFLLACVFLYVRLAGPKGIVATSGPGLIRQFGTNGAVFLVVGLLMLANWWIESFKWRVLLLGVERVPMGRAFLATIAGTSVGFVSINRTGEFLGRVLFLGPEQRAAGGFASALGSIAQFVVTLVAGGLALMLLTILGMPLPWMMGWVSWALATLTALVAFIAMVFYLHPGLLRRSLMLVPFLHRFEQASSVLAHYQRGDLLGVWLLSLARYLVFGLQFALLLRAFEAGAGTVETILAVPLIYLIATLIPSVMLTELGVRGSVAMAVLAPLGAVDGPVLLATTCLWTINVALPACAGSLILLFARISSTDRR